MGELFTVPTSSKAPILPDVGHIWQLPGQKTTQLHGIQVLT